MKTSLTIFSLLTLLSTPALASTGTMGLYADPDATINQIQSQGGQVPVYLVATNPEIPTGGTPANLMGFEAQVSFQSSRDFVMDASFPVDVINVGTLSNLIVGYGEPLPLGGSSVVVATLVIYTSGQSEANIFLGPSEPPSLPGYLALLNDDFSLIPMEPASGDAQRPVFYINSAGSLETTSWGTAKSLFR